MTKPSRPTIKSLKTERDKALTQVTSLTAELEDARITAQVMQGELQDAFSQKIEAKKQLIRLQMENQKLKSSQG